jgi:hypothetical protein
MNAQRGAQGWIPSADLEPWYIAKQLDIPESDAADGVTKAVTAGLLKAEDSCVIILGWGDDWSRRARTRAEIQKNYRERKKGTEERYEDEVTSDHQSNALPIRGEERRSERVHGNSLSLPEDFSASQEARKIAEDRRLDLVFELAQFRDHTQSAGWSSENWDASFCKWLRKSKDVDRAANERKIKPQVKARSGPHVSRQRTADGVRYLLTEEDGNQREISEEEARQFK